MFYGPSLKQGVGQVSTGDGAKSNNRRSSRERGSASCTHTFSGEFPALAAYHRWEPWVLVSRLLAFARCSRVVIASSSYYIQILYIHTKEIPRIVLI